MSSAPRALTIVPEPVRNRRGLVAAAAALGLALTTVALALPGAADATGYKEPFIEIEKVAVQEGQELAEDTVLLPGDTFDYVLTVSNTGKASADSVEIVDDLPAAVRPAGDITVRDGAAVVDTLPGADPVEVTLNDLGVDETRTITIPVEIIDRAKGCVRFDNTASAAYSPDGYGSITVDSNTVTLAVGCADLVVDKVADVDGPVAVGDEVTFDIRVSLADVDFPVAVAPVIITDTFDTDQFSFVSATDGGTHDSGEVTWVLEDGLAPGDPPTVVSLTLKVLPPGAEADNVYINNVCVSLPPDDSTPVVNPDDDCDEEPVKVPEGDSSLSLVKSNDPTGTLDGYLDPSGNPRTIAYAMTVSAGEGLDQEDVVITDTVPDGTALVEGSASCDGGPADCATVNGSEISFAIGDLAAETSKTVRFTVSLLPPEGSVVDGGTYVIRNVAVATSTTDETPSNEVENPVEIPPLVPSELSIVKANEPTGVVAFGATITYTLTVTADEDGSEQTGVVVTDTIPGYDPTQPTSGVTTYVPSSASCIGEPPPGGTCTINEVLTDGTTTGLSWGLGTMSPGETRQVSFAVTADEQDAVVEGSETVDFINVSAVESDAQPLTPSNEVTNTAVITEVSDNTPPDSTPPGTLPETGSGLPLARMALIGLLMVAAGAALVRQPKRRPGRHAAH